MRIPSLAVALAIAAALAAPALARTTRTDSVTARVHSAGHDSRGLIYRGTVTSRVFGRGTVVEHVTALGLRGSFRIKYKHGTVRGTSVAHARSRSDGSLALSGTYKLTSGTGTYKHVSGHGKFTGHGAANLSTATFTQRGRVTY